MDNGAWPSEAYSSHHAYNMSNAHGAPYNPSVPGQNTSTSAPPFTSIPYRSSSFSTSSHNEAGPPGPSYHHYASPQGMPGSGMSMPYYSSSVSGASPSPSPTNPNYPPTSSSFTGSPTYGAYASMDPAYSSSFPMASYNPYGGGYPDSRYCYLNPFEVKHRRRTTKTQFKLLESTFHETPKPSAALRKQLSVQLDMPQRAVQIWFQNRRAKAKAQARKNGTLPPSENGGAATASSSRSVDDNSSKDGRPDTADDPHLQGSDDGHTDREASGSSHSHQGHGLNDLRLSGIPGRDDDRSGSDPLLSSSQSQRQALLSSEDTDRYRQSSLHGLNAPSPDRPQTGSSHAVMSLPSVSSGLSSSIAYGQQAYSSSLSSTLSGATEFAPMSSSESAHARSLTSPGLSQQQSSNYATQGSSRAHQQDLMRNSSSWSMQSSPPGSSAQWSRQPPPILQEQGSEYQHRSWTTHHY